MSVSADGSDSVNANRLNNTADPPPSGCARLGELSVIGMMATCRCCNGACAADTLQCPTPSNCSTVSTQAHTATPPATAMEGSTLSNATTPPSSASVAPHRSARGGGGGGGHAADFLLTATTRDDYNNTGGIVGENFFSLIAGTDDGDAAVAEESARPSSEVVAGGRARRNTAAPQPSPLQDGDDAPPAGGDHPVGLAGAADTFCSSVADGVAITSTATADHFDCCGNSAAVNDGLLSPIHRHRSSAADDSDGDGDEGSCSSSSDDEERQRRATAATPAATNAPPLVVAEPPAAHADRDHQQQRVDPSSRGDTLLYRRRRGPPPPCLFIANFPRMHRSGNPNHRALAKSLRGNANRNDGQGSSTSPATSTSTSSSTSSGTSTIASAVTTAVSTSIEFLAEEEEDKGPRSCSSISTGSSRSGASSSRGPPRPIVGSVAGPFQHNAVEEGGGGGGGGPAEHHLVAKGRAAHFAPPPPPHPMDVSALQSVRPATFQRSPPLLPQPTSSSSRGATQPPNPVYFTFFRGKVSPRGGQHQQGLLTRCEYSPTTRPPSSGSSSGRGCAGHGGAAVLVPSPPSLLSLSGPAPKNGSGNGSSAPAHQRQHALPLLPSDGSDAFSSATHRLPLLPPAAMDLSPAATPRATRFRRRKSSSSGGAEGGGAHHHHHNRHNHHRDASGGSSGSAGCADEKRPSTCLTAAGTTIASTIGSSIASFLVHSRTASSTAALTSSSPSGSGSGSGHGAAACEGSSGGGGAQSALSQGDAGDFPATTRRSPPMLYFASPNAAADSTRSGFGGLLSSPIAAGRTSAHTHNGGGGGAAAAAGLTSASQSLSMSLSALREGWARARGRVGRVVSPPPPALHSHSDHSHHHHRTWGCGRANAVTRSYYEERLSYSGLFHRNAYDPVVGRETVGFIPSSSSSAASASRSSTSSTSRFVLAAAESRITIALTARKSVLSMAFLTLFVAIVLVCWLPRRFAIPPHMLSDGRSDGDDGANGTAVGPPQRTPPRHRRPLPVVRDASFLTAFDMQNLREALRLASEGGDDNALTSEWRAVPSAEYRRNRHHRDSVAQHSCGGGGASARVSSSNSDANVDVGRALDQSALVWGEARRRAPFSETHRPRDNNTGDALRDFAPIRPHAHEPRSSSSSRALWAAAPTTSTPPPIDQTHLTQHRFQVATAKGGGGDGSGKPFLTTVVSVDDIVCPDEGEVAAFVRAETISFNRQQIAEAGGTGGGEGSGEEVSVFTRCACPRRLDVEQHYLRTGGAEGLKEAPHRLGDRAHTFRVVLGDLRDSVGSVSSSSSSSRLWQVVSRIAASERAAAMARGVCGVGGDHLFASATIDVLLPGQQMAVGLSAPQADAHAHGGGGESSSGTPAFPSWLRAAMRFSGLFEGDGQEEEGAGDDGQADIFTFFHDWRVQGPHRGGALRYWDSAERPNGVDAAADAGTAVAFDGTRIVHTPSLLYGLSSSGHTQLPRMERRIVVTGAATQTVGKATAEPMKARLLVPTLGFSRAAGLWELKVGGEVAARYREEDLRFGLKLTASCSRGGDAGEASSPPNATCTAAPSAERRPSPSSVSLLGAVRALRADLQRRDVGIARGHMSPSEFGLLVGRAYTRYPLPHNAEVPYNYCWWLGRSDWASSALRSLLCG